MHFNKTVRNLKIRKKAVKLLTFGMIVYLKSKTN